MIINPYIFSIIPDMYLSLDKRPGYSGSAIRVRRSSDNAEQDIGFTGINLDTASLLSFTGAGDGFVTIWYDQAGVNNAIQTTASNQPRIVVSGSLELSNSKVCVNFGINSDPWFLELPNGFLHLTNNLSFFSVLEVTDFAGSNAGVFAPTGSNSIGLEILQTTVISRRSLLRINNNLRNDNGGAGYQMWDDATQSLMTIQGDSSALNVYKNEASVTLTDSSALPALNYNGIYSIGRYSGGNYMYGKIQEIQIYTKSVNRSAIESDINSRY